MSDNVTVPRLEYRDLIESRVILDYVHKLAKKEKHIDSKEILELFGESTEEEDDF